MVYIIVVAVCFIASAVGSICGIGGGVIIKPVLDATGIMNVSTINFLSGCTVLSMSVISVIKKLKKSGSGEHFDKKIATLLAVGAVIGGLTGKTLYQQIVTQLPDTQKIGSVQAAVLLVVVAGTLIYTLNKSKIKTYKVKGSVACILIGSFLGLLSAFLGIGGGPFNLVILFFFFSMSTKEAASYSLYIIMFSQFASLIKTIVTGEIPEFSMAMLILMVSCGVLGGVVGSLVNAKLKERHVDKLFICLMCVIIIISAYNVFKYI